MRCVKKLYSKSYYAYILYYIDIYMYIYIYITTCTSCICKLLYIYYS